MDSYRIFTVSAGEVEDGARVSSFRLKGANIEIPAIIVGEAGRGRELGVLPVAGAEPGDRILAARLTTTRSGRPKLVAVRAATSDEQAIVVLQTPIGYRGSNEHTGDRDGTYEVGTPRRSWYRQFPSYALALRYAEEKDIHPDNIYPAGFLPFPGRVIVEGRIAQGMAGRMGSGRQMVALIPKGQVFRTGYSGRLYGRPAAHYYVFNGRTILAATWEERQLADLF